MNPWVQGKPGGDRSHPPLNRIKDWLCGGPSQRAAVTGTMHHPTRMRVHHTMIRLYPGILFIPLSFEFPYNNVIGYHILLWYRRH
jgi:hypothetical protein